MRGFSWHNSGEREEVFIYIAIYYFTEGEKLELLHPVAGIHVTMRKMRERRKNLFKVGPFDRAISAREDIAMR